MGRISPATEVHLTRYIELGQGFRHGQSSYSALRKHALISAAQSVKPIEEGPRLSSREKIVGFVAWNNRWVSPVRVTTYGCEEWKNFRNFFLRDGASVYIYIDFRGFQVDSYEMGRLAHKLSVYLLALLFALVYARSAETNPTSNSIDEEAGRSTGNSNVFGDLRQMYQIYKECADEDLSSCLKVRLLSVIDRVSRSVQLNVADGVTFVQDDPISSVAEEEAPKSLQEIEASLPRSLEDKEDALNTMIFDKVVKFFQSHTLKLKLPNVEELQRSLVEEGENRDLQ